MREDSLLLIKYFNTMIWCISVDTVICCKKKSAIPKVLKNHIFSIET